MARPQGLSRSIFLEMGGQHLVDPLAVHVDDLEAPAFPFHRIGDVEAGDPAAASPCRPRVLYRSRSSSGSALMRQAVFQLGDGDEAVDQPGAVFALDGPGIVGVRGVNSPVMASSTSAG